MGIDDVADIDDLLASDEAVKPSIVEPITIGDDELEPEIDDLDTGDVELVGSAPAAPAPAAPPEPEPEPEPEPVAAAPEIDIGGLDLSTDDGDPFEEAVAEAPEPAIEAPVSRSQPVPEPTIEAPEPTIEPAAPPPAPAPAAAAPAPAPAPKPAAPPPAAAPAAARTGGGDRGRTAVINLVPVMEEEFQHAITHGKSRIFEKWTSLQTRNRILNAVLVENELDPLLADLYAHGTRVAV